MEPIYITYLLRKNGTSQAKIAKKLEVSKTAVSLVVAGRSTSARIKRAIAKALKMKVKEIWPDAA